MLDLLEILLVLTSVFGLDIEGLRIDEKTMALKLCSCHFMLLYKSFRSEI